VFLLFLYLGCNKQFILRSINLLIIFLIYTFSLLGIVLKVTSSEVFCLQSYTSYFYFRIDYNRLCTFCNYAISLILLFSHTQLILLNVKKLYKEYFLELFVLHFLILSCKDFLKLSFEKY